MIACHHDDYIEDISPTQPISLPFRATDTFGGPEIKTVERPLSQYMQCKGDLILGPHSPGPGRLTPWSPMSVSLPAVPSNYLTWHIVWLTSDCDWNHHVHWVHSIKLHIAVCGHFKNSKTSSDKWASTSHTSKTRRYCRGFFCYAWQLDAKVLLHRTVHVNMNMNRTHRPMTRTYLISDWLLYIHL